MCTASWSAGHGRLSLCFNRDERKTRPEALAPAVLDLPGPKRVAAIDPKGGGTWLAVNEHGLCVYLLNNYAAEARRRQNDGAISRGRLPIELTGFRKRADALKHLRGAMDLEAYNPFLLVVADCEGAEASDWDGESLTPFETPVGLLTTSSFRTEEVQAYRLERYLQCLEGRSKLDLAERLAFHTERANDDPAFNPMMLREDARTHSVATVEIGENTVRFVYEKVLGDTRTLASPVAVEIALDV